MRAVTAITLDSPPRVVGLVDDAGDVLADVAGLQLGKVLEWLTGSRSQSGASLSGWGISPFVECLAMQMPLMQRGMLTSAQSTPFDHGTWRLLWIPGKFLEIRRLRRLWRLFDVSGMFPAGLTLDQILIRWSASENASQPVQLALWGVGKPSHRTWAALGLESALAAARERSRGIAVLMVRVRHALDRLDLLPARWHGIGSVASRILNDAKLFPQVAKYSPDRQPEVNGVPLLPVFLSASYGGRMETTVAGTWSGFPTYRYDIRSAYAWALSHVGPVGFEWETRDRFSHDSNDRMSLWYVRWNMAEGSPLGPLPYRNQLGGISFPANGSGWYWWPEVRAALHSYGEASIHVVSGYVSPRSRRRPLSGEIGRRWQQRRELERAGDPAADLLKTGMAAVYGRLAQRESSGGLPGRFYNPAIAGWVCSAVRARLLSAYAGRERDVVALATDAIISVHPLPNARVSGDLGGWKQETWAEVSYVLPGVYRLRQPQVHDWVREEVATAGVHGVDFDDLLTQLTDYGRAEYGQEWFVPNILADQYADTWESRRCQFINTPVSINPYRVSRKRQNGDGLIGMDWRTDCHIMNAPHQRGGIGDSWPTDGPPAWGGLTDPIALALRHVAKTR